MKFSKGLKWHFQRPFPAGCGHYFPHHVYLYFRLLTMFLCFSKKIKTENVRLSASATFFFFFAFCLAWHQKHDQLKIFEVQGAVFHENNSSARHMGARSVRKWSRDQLLWLFVCLLQAISFTVFHSSFLRSSTKKTNFILGRGSSAGLWTVLIISCCWEVWQSLGKTL